jgi:hypothetical protein
VNPLVIVAVPRGPGHQATGAATEETHVIRRSLGLGAAAGLLAVTVAGGASAAAGSIWHVVPSENPQHHQVTNSLFTGVSGVSATDGWAVGQFDDANALGHPLAEHWNGSAWTRVAAPEPHGRQAALAGVDELSTGEAWAVGDSANGSPGEGNIDSLPLIEHWNGTAWSVARGASLPSGSTGVLNAVGGSGPHDLWAVGYALNADATIEQVLFEHFDGHTWQQAPFPAQTAACDPNAADCFINPKAVSATSPDDVWVVGTVMEPNPTANFVAHWDGTAWSVVSAPCLTGQAVTACSGQGNDLNQLTGVVAISSGNAWASGSEGNVNGQNFHVPYVEHWNGTAWSLVKTPNRGGEGSLLNGITAPGASDIWAVGQTQQLNGAIRPLTEQFNGAAWSAVPSPVPGSSGRIPDDSLTGAAGLRGGLVFAVGARDIPGQCCLRTLGLTTTAG